MIEDDAPTANQSDPFLAVFFPEHAPKGTRVPRHLVETSRAELLSIYRIFMRSRPRRHDRLSRRFLRGTYG